MTDPSVIGEAYGAAMVPQTIVDPNFTMGNGNTGKAEKKGKARKKGKAAKNADQYQNTYGPNGAYGQYQNTYGPNGAYEQYQNTYGPNDTYGQYQNTYGSNDTYGQYQNGYGQYQNNYGQNGAYGQAGGPHKYKDESTAFEDNVKRFGNWIGRVARASVINYFEIWYKGERVLHFPVVLFLFCLIHWVFWLALIILLIGLFCGWRYQFSGPHLGKKDINDTMNKASDFAEEAKDGKDPNN